MSLVQVAYAVPHEVLHVALLHRAVTQQILDTAQAHIPDPELHASLLRVTDL